MSVNQERDRIIQFARGATVGCPHLRTTHDTYLHSQTLSSTI